MSNFEIKQYIHRPNNTELGLGFTHDCYLLIASNCPLQNKFSETESIDINFTDTQDSSNVKLRFQKLGKSNREHRITKLSEYKGKYQLRYGDEIRLETIIKDNSHIFYGISCIKRKCLVISYSKGLYEVINTDYIEHFSNETENKFDIYYNNQPSILSITYNKNCKKRGDSPTETELYNVTINGANLETSTSYFLDLDTNILSKINKWEYHELKYLENE